MSDPERSVAQVLDDVSQLDLVDVLRDGRACAWCHRPRLEHDRPAQRRDWIYGNKRCRQAAHRFGVDRAEPAPTRLEPMRFAYADPPYPGKSDRYKDHPDGGRGEVDHDELVARLAAGYPDGWALSTSSEALQRILAICPADVRVAAWMRPVRRTRSLRPLQAWEPVVMRGGRPLPTVVRHDVHDALIYRGRYRTFPGALVGMKPPQFAEWLFRMLGARRDDELDDLFPGSGAVGVAWHRYTAGRPVLPAHLRP